MREELTSLGIKELRTAEAVDQAVQSTPGTLMIVVNSVCGCAAGKARPGIALALNHAITPDVSATVFAGADTAATDRARQYFTGYPPSSPAVGIIKGGKLVYLMERHQIESRSAELIANDSSPPRQSRAPHPSPASDSLRLPPPSGPVAAAPASPRSAGRSTTGARPCAPPSRSRHPASASMTGLS